MMRPVINLFKRNQSLEMIATGAFVAFGLRVIGFALNFLFSIVMVRLIGASGSGLYYISFSIVSFSAAVSQMGLADTVLRFVASDMAYENWSGIAGISRKSRNAIVVVGSVITILLITLAPLLAYLFNEPQLTTVLRLMAIAITPLALINIYAAMLRSVDQIFASMLISSPLLPFFGLVLLLPFAKAWSVTGVAATYMLSTVITCFIGIRLWHRYTPFLRGIKGHFDNPTIIKTARSLFWVTMLGSLLSTIDTTVLGIFTTSAAVGIYSVARRAIGLVQFIILAINVVVAPRFSILHSQKKMDEFRSLARLVARLTTFAAIPSLLPFIIFPKLILSAFGSEFTLGAPVLVILAIGQFIDMTTGTVTYLLSMTGYEKAVRNTMILTVMTNLILTILLAARFGIIGAAIAMALTTFVLNAVSVVQVYYLLNIFVLPIPFLGIKVK